MFQLRLPSRHRSSMTHILFIICSSFLVALALAAEITAISFSGLSYSPLTAYHYPHQGWKASFDFSIKNSVSKGDYFDLSMAHVYRVKFDNDDSSMIAELQDGTQAFQCYVTQQAAYKFEKTKLRCTALKELSSPLSGSISFTLSFSSGGSAYSYELENAGVFHAGTNDVPLGEKMSAPITFDASQFDGEIYTIGRTTTYNNFETYYSAMKCQNGYLLGGVQTINYDKLGQHLNLDCSSAQVYLSDKFNDWSLPLEYEQAGPSVSCSQSILEVSLNHTNENQRLWINALQSVADGINTIQHDVQLKYSCSDTLKNTVYFTDFHTIVEYTIYQGSAFATVSEGNSQTVTSTATCHKCSTTSSSSSVSSGSSVPSTTSSNSSTMSTVSCSGCQHSSSTITSSTTPSSPKPSSSTPSSSKLSSSTPSSSMPSSSMPSSSAPPSSASSISTSSGWTSSTSTPSSSTPSSFSSTPSGSSPSNSTSSSSISDSISSTFTTSSVLTSSSLASQSLSILPSSSSVPSPTISTVSSSCTFCETTNESFSQAIPSSPSWPPVDKTSQDSPTASTGTSHSCTECHGSGTSSTLSSTSREPFSCNTCPDSSGSDAFTIQPTECLSCLEDATPIPSTDSNATVYSVNSTMVQSTVWSSTTISLITEQSQEIIKTSSNSINTLIPFNTLTSTTSLSDSTSSTPRPLSLQPTPLVSDSSTSIYDGKAAALPIGDPFTLFCALFFLML